MKKLVLAPVVALAITGLAASPVIAAPNSGDAFSRTGVQTPATGGESKTAEADVQKIEASVSVSPTEISQTDLADAKKGVDVTVTGLEAGDVVTDSLTGEETVAEGATVTFTIINDSGDPEKVPAGPVDFTVTVDRGTESATYDASFTVTPDETEEPTAPAVDPKAKFASEKISVSEIESKGLKFSGEGFTPGGTVSIEGISTPQSGDKAGVQAAQAGTQADIITADEDGKITGTLIAPEGAAKVGKYVVAFVDDKTGEKTEAVEFTVTEDATEEPTTPAADAKLIISPETVSPKDFVDQKKGVKVAIENCKPGEDVRFLVNPKSDINVTAFDRTVKADDKGTAFVNVYGTSASNPSAYIGDYSVTVTCGDDKLTGEFSVENEANAGGGGGDNDNGGNAGGGGDLPRTGMELGGLAAGAALLLVGGAAVVMTKRRRSAAVSPSDI
ncbi:hypothetical protein KACC15558_31690 [Brevibacterium ammoniilyticum]|uniref:LPXTG-motif cell wall anchor domain-containing protein n=1 Tax=Brevibacterium ammoniilyticum TaxID=1046555 RepID=A0ABP9U778_9MICO